MTTAALAGPWLITFAIVAVNYTLALLLVRRRAALGTAAVVALMSAALAVGALAVAVDAGMPTGIVPAAVQPGYDTANEKLPELEFFERGSWYVAARETIADLGELTLQASRAGANLVVWPEATIWVDPYRFETMGRKLARLARASGVTLVVPWFDADARQGAAVIVDPEQALLRAQPKQRPMWFLGERGGNRVPPAAVIAGDAAIGALLGVDTQDPGLARRFAAGSGDAEPADVLAASTHDWKQLADQQLALSRVSAAATGIPFVRADWRFRSAVIDGDGSLAATARPGLRRTAAVGPEVTRYSTPYASTGDALGWAATGCVAAALLGLVAPRTWPLRP